MAMIIICLGCWPDSDLSCLFWLAEYWVCFSLPALHALLWAVSCWLSIALAGLLACCLDWLRYNYINPNPDHEMLVLAINNLACLIFAKS